MSRLGQLLSAYLKARKGSQPQSSVPHVDFCLCLGYQWEGAEKAEEGSIKEIGTDRFQCHSHGKDAFSDLCKKGLQSNNRSLRQSEPAFSARQVPSSYCRGQLSAALGLVKAPNFSEVHYATLCIPCMQQCWCEISLHQNKQGPMLWSAYLLNSCIKHTAFMASFSQCCTIKNWCTPLTLKSYRCKSCRCIFTNENWWSAAPEHHRVEQTTVHQETALHQKHS